jgi:hypothetical protein
MAETAKKTRDKWDKLDIILKFAGGVMTALAVALVGFQGSRYLTHQQDIEANLRLYTELMSHREEADTSLRKEMFNSIITNFLKPAYSQRLDKKILNLELLAYNFHDSLDLGPLFKDVQRQLYKHPPSDQDKQYLDRLVKLTRDVIDKQIAMIVEEAGDKRDAVITFSDLKADPRGIVTVIDDSFPVKDDGRKHIVAMQHVIVEVLRIDREKREMQVRLVENTSQKATGTDALFWVGFFDFPMLDNVRLSQGYRCSIVLREFEGESAEITLVHFPSSRASLKEKPFYDEILYKLRNPPRP